MRYIVRAIVLAAAGWSIVSMSPAVRAHGGIASRSLTRAGSGSGRVRFLPTPTTFGPNTVAVYGNTVVWWGQQPGSSSQGVWKGSLSHWQPQKLVSLNGPFSKFNALQLSGTWLVWIQYSDFSPTYRIMARNRTTGHTFTVERISARGGVTMAPLFSAISLHQSRLAWTYELCVNHCSNPQREVVRSYLAVASLPTTQPRIVASATLPCQLSSPSIWGNVVTWDRQGQCADERESDVFLDNLTRPRVVRVTRDHGSFQPVTNGRFLAWVRGLPGDTGVGGKIMLRNLATNRQSIVSRVVPGPSDAPCYQPNMCQTHPVMTSRLVAWSAAFRNDFKAYNLTTGKAYSVFTATSVHQPSSDLGQPSGNTLGWSDGHILASKRQIFGLAIAQLP